MAEWFYSINDEKLGPVSTDEIKKLAATGKLSREDLVWREGFEEWVAAHRVKGIFKAPPPVPKKQKASGVSTPLPGKSQSPPVSASRGSPAPKSQSEYVEAPGKEPQKPTKSKAGVIAAVVVGLVLVGVAGIALLNGDGKPNRSLPGASQASANKEGVLGYKNARWGMSKSQVTAANGIGPWKDSAGKTYDGLDLVTGVGLSTLDQRYEKYMYPIEMGGGARVGEAEYYYFDQGKLVAVEVVRDGRGCAEGLAEGMIALYGKPTGSKKIADAKREVLWRFPNGSKAQLEIGKVGAQEIASVTFYAPDIPLKMPVASGTQEGGSARKPSSSARPEPVRPDARPSREGALGQAPIRATDGFPVQVIRDANGRPKGIVGCWKDFRFGLFREDIEKLTGGKLQSNRSGSFMFKQGEGPTWPLFETPEKQLFKGNVDIRGRVREVVIGQKFALLFHRRAGLVACKEKTRCNFSEIFDLFKSKIIEQATKNLGRPPQRSGNRLAWSFPDGSRFVIEDHGRELTRYIERRGLKDLRDKDELGGYVRFPDGSIPEKPEQEIRVTKLLKGPSGKILHLAFSPDSKRLASAAMDKTVELWDAKTGTRLKRLIGHKAPVINVWFTPDSRQILSLSEARQGGSLRLWDVLSGRQIKKWEPVEGRFFPSPDVSVGVIAQSGSMSWWSKDKPGFGPKQKISYANDVVHSRNRLMLMRESFLGVWSSAGRRALYALGKVDPFELRRHDWKSIKTLMPGEKFRGADFSPDGRELATASEEHAVRLHEARTGEVKRELAERVLDVREVHWLEGDCLLTRSGDRTAAWDARTGRKLVDIPRGKGHVRGLLVTEDRMLALVNQAMLFDPIDRKCARIAASQAFGVCESLAIANDKSTVAFVGLRARSNRSELFLAVLDDPHRGKGWADRHKAVPRATLIDRPDQKDDLADKKPTERREPVQPPDTVAQTEDKAETKPGDAEGKVRRKAPDASKDNELAREISLDLGGQSKLPAVLVPGGEFLMGSNDSATDIARRFGGKSRWYASEGPQHRVKITKAFYMGKYPVTVGQFRRFVGASGHRTSAERAGRAKIYKGGGFKEVRGASWKSPGFSQGDDHPVVVVSWHDATAFAAWASRQTGRKVRLPTEAEWEYACRAGTQTQFHSGNTRRDLASVAWYIVNSRRRTQPVGRKAANRLGLHDMHGMVWEWVADYFSARYYSTSPKADPTGPPTGTGRVKRGGSWYRESGSCRSAARGQAEPGHANSSYGFRVLVEAR